VITFQSDRLDAILARHAVLGDLLSSPMNGESFVAASKELSELEPVVAAIQAWRSAQDNLDGLEALLKDSSTDAEMRSLIWDERPQAERAVEEAAKTLRLCLLPKDKDDEKSAILEIRAGTGGDEASLFAGDLLRMYSRYAAVRGCFRDHI
jgi:peptide chain release factor 1